MHIAKHRSALQRYKQLPALPAPRPPHTAKRKAPIRRMAGFYCNQILTTSASLMPPTPRVSFPVPLLKKTETCKKAVPDQGPSKAVVETPFPLQHQKFPIISYHFWFQQIQLGTRFHSQIPPSLQHCRINRPRLNNHVGECPDSALNP